MAYLSPIRELFGGAIVCRLPATFEDISVYRPVPDHQEVFVDKISNISLIVETLSQPEGLANENAGEFYFRDLAELNNAVSASIEFVHVFSSQDVMPELNAVVPVCAVVGKQQIEKNHQMETLRLYMVIIRLHSVGTDLLITLNYPPLEGPSMPVGTAEIGGAVNPVSIFSHSQEDAAIRLRGSWGPAEHAFNNILRSFRIENWSLFG